MRRDLLAVVVGALVAAAFPTPTRQGSGAHANVAYDGPAIMQDVSMPEFVPVINFSQFLLAARQYGATVRPAGRVAAEALSAKFASLPNPGSEPRLIIGQSDPIGATALGAAMVPDPKELLDGGREQIGRVAGAGWAAAAGVPDTERPLPVVEGSRSASRVHERTARQFGPAMGLGAGDDATKVVIKRQAQRSRGRQLASAQKGYPRPSVLPAVAPKLDYQVGIPGQSMEPLISSCTKATRTCFLGLLCGC